MREIATLQPSFDPGASRRIGLVSLASDEVSSDEIRAVLAAPGLAIHETRIANSDIITPESLLAMAEGLTESASRLPGAVPYDAIGYLCTSASMLIGADGVAARVRAACPGAAVTNPMEAGLAACRALGAARIALATPYVAEVTDGIAAAFEAGGLEVVRAASFFVNSDTRVARISAEALGEAVAGLAGGVDAVFLSCTALRTVHHVAAIEDRAGVPLVTSNQAVAWRLARLAEVTPAPGAWGVLWSRG
ncbi:Asp/Glu racemase [Limibaculum sp. M0105]|uniref:Asp/Glu racemase n=1 Tax=Thermohalobaculum xanthum TaxID=2753746 RepID=A0A8J7SF58_9RHOB|nr:Asp/Glu racemase [Thermohalobaculum xanthum]MBK0399931.1 Asp/Glu racemase [Thermohalobaculum xanthum]